MIPSCVDYTYMQNTVWRLKAVYPALRVKTAGKSVVGRSLYTLEVGREAAEEVLFLGTLGGTDDMSGPLLLTFMECLLRAAARDESIGGISARRLLRGRRVVAWPFVNPDGREICARGVHCGCLDSGRIRRLCGGHDDRWNANARGVTVARNFDHRFAARRVAQREAGVYGPSPDGFGGTAAESEPETAAVAEHCRRSPVRLAVALYPGQGAIYWRGEWQGERTERAARVLALSAGYQVEASVGRPTYTGFRNWFQSALQRPAFDIMIRRNDPSVPPRDPYPQLEETLSLTCVL